MKKIMKWCGGALLSVTLLCAIPVALLYFPPFQQWAAKKAAAYASEQTGMDISVDRVRLKFPLRLSLQGVKAVKRQPPAQRDTIADIGEVVADVQLLPLLKKKVEIDQLDFNNAKINTDNFIKNARVKGSIGRLSMASHGIDLRQQTLRLDQATLQQANLSVELSDTAAVDTTKSDTRWKIHTDKLQVKDSKVKVALADNETLVKADIKTAAAENGDFDLGSGDYKLEQLTLEDSTVSYDKKSAPHTDGLDTNHLALDKVNLKASNIHYKEPRLDMKLENLSFHEKSGAEVKSLSGDVTVNNGKAHLSGVRLETSESTLQTDLDLDLNTFDATTPGQLDSHIHGKVGKNDLMRFLNGLPKGFRQQWPDQPLALDGRLSGNLQHLTLHDMHAVLPGSFDATLNGFVQNLDNSAPLKADVRFDVKGQNLDFANQLLDADTRREFRIPRSLAAKGRLQMDGSCYNVDLNAQQSGGTLQGNVKYCEQRPTYSVNLTGRQFPLQHFLPNMNLSRFTGHVKAHGAGLDFLSSRTTLEATAEIRQLQYDGYLLDNSKVVANMKNGWLDAAINMENALAHGTVQARVKVNDKQLDATLLCDLTRLDFKRLGVVDNPLVANLCGTADIQSDLNNHHHIVGNFEDLTLWEGNDVYRPEHIGFDINLQPRLTQANVDCADFHLDFRAGEGYERLMAVGSRLGDELKKQYKAKQIDQQALRRMLPDATLNLRSGSDNFMMKMLGKYGYQARKLDCQLVSSANDGLNGYLKVDTLTTEGMQLDRIRLALTSDSDQISYEGQIKNYKGNPQYAFNALLNGSFHEKGAYLSTQIFDENDKLGVQLGLNGQMEEGGIRITPYGEDPILGYKQFHNGQSNYVFLGEDQRLSANVLLRADDGTGVQVYTNDDNEEALQDITVSLNRFDLEKVLSVIPYTPSVSGQMNGDFHLIKTEKELSVASDIDFRNLVYEHVPMGNLNTEFVYIPKPDGSHYVDGYLYSEGREVASIVGSYRSGTAAASDHLDAKLKLDRTPMSMINGFIDNQVLGFEGFATGNMSVVGSLERPDVDGVLQLDSAYLVSEPYGIRMRFTEDPIKVEDSHIVFDNFNMYGYNDSPLRLNGTLDFSNIQRMSMDVRMVARNFLLVNSKETERSEAYGKAYVNLFATLRGQLSQLNMRGRLDVLGTTDLGYILRDSPLSTSNQLEELVQFVNLSDTTHQVVSRPPLVGFNMDLSVKIDEGAHVECALNPDHSNYIDVIGGGDLRLQYNPVDDFRLTGRYTLSSGEMKYSLPIIPLKTFTIQDDSYIEFSGDPMNPTLNITATERTKSNVSDDSGHGRTVVFDCGVVMTKTLNDMGLEFIVNAPEDLTVNNQLAMMSKEERGKIAVTMLTTGMYLADGNTSGFTMNAALSAFLQSQINNIAGNALRTLDFSFGVDNSTSASGSLQTDYSFKFAKRFWNNRLNVQVGGKVSTGSEVESQNQNLFNNVILEYRLNNAASKYVKLFYERDRYDWLEGNVGEYGAGFVWKRKVEHFKDLFRFKEKPMTMPRPEKRDSVKPDTIKVQPNEP